MARDREGQQAHGGRKKTVATVVFATRTPKLARAHDCGLCSDQVRRMKECGKKYRDSEGYAPGPTNRCPIAVLTPDCIMAFRAASFVEAGLIGLGDMDAWTLDMVLEIRRASAQAMCMED